MTLYQQAVEVARYSITRPQVDGSAVVFSFSPPISMSKVRIQGNSAFVRENDMFINLAEIEVYAGTECGVYVYKYDFSLYVGGK